MEFILQDRTWKKKLIHKLLFFIAIVVLFFICIISFSYFSIDINADGSFVPIMMSIIILFPLAIVIMALLIEGTIFLHFKKDKRANFLLHDCGIDDTYIVFSGKTKSRTPFYISVQKNFIDKINIELTVTSEATLSPSSRRQPSGSVLYVRGHIEIFYDGNQKVTIIVNHCCHDSNSDLIHKIIRERENAKDFNFSITAYEEKVQKEIVNYFTSRHPGLECCAVIPDDKYPDTNSY